MSCFPFPTCAGVLIFLRATAAAVVAIGSHHLLARVSVLYPIRTSQTFLITGLEAVVFARTGTVIAKFCHQCITFETLFDPISAGLSVLVRGFNAHGGIIGRTRTRALITIHIDHLRAAEALVYPVLAGQSIVVSRFLAFL